MSATALWAARADYAASGSQVVSGGAARGPCPALVPVCKSLGSHRRRPEIPLAEMTAEADELCTLGRGFDALSADLESEGIAKAHYRTHYRGIVRVVGDAIDKGPVDLQRGDREALQI